MHRAVLLTLVLAYANLAYGTGWNDYELEISPGLFIVRGATVDYWLQTTGGEVLVESPLAKMPSTVGPIRMYAVTDSTIYTKQFATEKFSIPDTEMIEFSDKPLYTAIDIKTLSVSKKMDEVAFNKLPGVGKLEWLKPENPNFWLPLSGGIFVLSIPVAIFGLPLLVYWLLCKWLDRRANKDA